VSHRSISRGVLRHAPMNVACVPAARAVAHGRGGRAHIRRVLVATDLSPMGDRAIPWAFATLAPGGVVKLVHVLSPWAAPGALFPRPNSRRSSRDAHERRVNAAREKLRTLVPPEAPTNGIATEVEVIEDRDPARAIGVAAQRFGADLVCLSSHGRTTVAETLRGSVARAVVAQNLQPVLLVQPAPP
jgi:nucleotide-binding universal stress UspA family protein